MKQNICLFLLFCMVSVPVYSAGENWKTLNSPSKIRDDDKSGPGTLAGLRIGYYNNRAFDFDGNKRTNTGPTREITLLPTVIFRLMGQMYLSAAFGINNYRNLDYGNSYENEVRERYTGGSIGLYRYCDDPCDEDDWYPYGGIELEYWGGSREYRQTNKQTNITISQNGKVSNISEALVGGAYYGVTDRIGLYGSLNLVRMDNYRTIPNNSNSNQGWGNTQYHVFDGARMGVMFQF